MSIAVMSMLSKTCLFEQGKAYPVVLAMADWASDDGGDIYPGIDLLAAKSRTSVRTLQSVLRQLEQDGIISRVANAKGGRGKITEYKINLERVRELQALHEAQEPDCPWCYAWRRSNEKRVQARAQRVRERDVKGASRAQKGAKIGACIEEPSTEPSMNLSLEVGERELNVLEEEEPTSMEAVFDAFLGWPGVDPDFSRTDVEAAINSVQRLADAPSLGELVRCIRRRGQWLVGENARRPAHAGARLVEAPHRWVLAQKFVSELRRHREHASLAVEMNAEVQAIRARLGPDAMAALDQLKIQPSELKPWFGDCDFRGGANPAFIFGREFCRNYVDNKYSTRLTAALKVEFLRFEVRKRAVP